MSIKYPKNEELAQTFRDVGGNIRYIITYKKIKDGYILYQLNCGKFEKVGKCRSPNELDRKFKFKQNLLVSKNCTK